MKISDLIASAPLLDAPRAEWDAWMRNLDDAQWVELIRTARDAVPESLRPRWRSAIVAVPPPIAAVAVLRAASEPPAKPLPRTGGELLALLKSVGGSIDYHDPRVRAIGSSGLTALRHRGLARVESGRNHPALIVWTPTTEGTL